MKVYIDHDEWPDVRFPNKEIPFYTNYSTVLEVSPRTYARWMKTYKAFEKMQKDLRKRAHRHQADYKANSI